MKKITLLIAVISLTLLSSHAFAGQKWFNAVLIGTNNFQGTLGYTRNTADNVQYIGCTDYGNSVVCRARNLAGTTRSCSSNNPAHIAAVRGINGDSNIYVSIDSSGRCSSMIIRHTSQDAPK